MRIYAHSTWKSKNLQSGPCSTKAHAFKLQVLREELTNDSTRIKKHAEIRHVVFTMGKLIHFPTFSLPFALEEKEKATQKDREKIEELELRGEIGAGRHVLPDVRVLSLSANPAQDWADLRQAALGRLKEENAMLLLRLSALEASGTHTAYPLPPTPRPARPARRRS
jgi:hypothetical protein